MRCTFLERMLIEHMAMREILKVLYNKTQSEFNIELKQKLVNKEKSFIITANPEIIMKSKKYEDIHDMLLDKRLTIVADGIGVVKAYDMLSLGSVSRIPGVETVEKLFEYGNELSSSLCILGAQQSVLDALKLIFQEKYPNLKLLSAVNGYVEDKDAVMDGFKNLHPDIVLVALGVPSQERLIYKHYDAFEHGIFVGIGGSLDVLSGTKKRAPKVFVKLNLEWLYRICKEPKRFKRFYDNNIRFISEIRKER